MGRATLILVTLHFGLYALAWGISGGWDRVWDETLQVCAHAGRVHGGEAFRSRCHGVANLFGFMAWCVGVVIGVTSLYAVRRRSYALFMVAHQLHWAWWFFGVLHWAGMLSFVAPALVFFLEDVDAGAAAAELVFATVGARPDLGDILRRANEELGADADVLIGGPQRLVDGLEDRLKGRVVERMTWAM